MKNGDDVSNFARRALIAIGLTALVAVLLFFFSQLIDVLLLLFAAALGAAGIDGVTRLIGRYAPWSRTWSLLLALFAMLLFIVAIAALVGPRIAEQLPRLVEQLPEAARQVVGTVQELPGGSEAVEAAENPVEFINQDMARQFTGVFSTTFGAITSFLLIVLLSIYFAISPGMYIDNMIRLIPVARRERVREVVAIQGSALRLWLLSRLISMLFVGIAVGAGLTFLGVPMALALGLIAGLLTFVPYIGPLLGMVPTGLIALLEGPQLAVYAVLLYFVVETIEGYLVTPLAAKRVVDLPPGYTVVVQIAGGAVAGLPGVILATPLAIAAVVAVQTLYIEDVLGDDVTVLGEDNG